MATNINLGKQQITIYPYQEITSVNANQILYQLVQPGVSNIKVEVYAPLEPGQFGVKIYSGATMVFEQSLTESGVDRKFLVKCVLEDDVTFELSKAQYWSGSNMDADCLYVYADLNYDLNTDARYANFAVVADKNIIEEGKNLVLATLINHQYYTKEYNSVPEKKPNVPLNYYHVSYQDQKNPDVFPELYNSINNFTPRIHGNMTDIIVPGGVFISGNTIVQMPETTTQPPAKLTVYPAGTTTDDFYQVDVLRIKITKSSPRVAGVAWDSTLVPKPTPAEQWVWSVSYAWTEEKLLSYLSEVNLDLYDTGYVLMVLVRANNATVYDSTMKEQSYTSWARLAFNKVHPSLCYIPKKSIVRLDVPDLYSRFKVPAYATSEVVINPADV